MVLFTGGRSIRLGGRARARSAVGSGHAGSHSRDCLRPIPPHANRACTECASGDCAGSDADHVATRLRDRFPGVGCSNRVASVGNRRAGSGQNRNTPVGAAYQSPIQRVFRSATKVTRHFLAHETRRFRNLAAGCLQRLATVATGDGRSLRLRSDSIPAYEAKPPQRAQVGRSRWR